MPYSSPSGVSSNSICISTMCVIPARATCSMFLSVQMPPPTAIRSVIQFSSITLGCHLRIVFVGQFQLLQQQLCQAILRLRLLLFLPRRKDAHELKEKSCCQIIALFRGRYNCAEYPGYVPTIVSIACR